MTPLFIYFAVVQVLTFLAGFFDLFGDDHDQ